MVVYVFVIVMQEYDPDSTDAIVNAESDTSTVCPDSVDNCVSPVLKVIFLFIVLCSCGVIGYCPKFI